MVRTEVVVAALAALASPASSSTTMTCGSGVALCGVLTLETGLGSGTYSHPSPVVHGLWPETGSYGTSECLAPKNAATPTTLYSCYDQEGESSSSCLSFEQHEWSAHGLCSGCASAADYFTQICSISSAPLKVMASAGGSLTNQANALTKAGYEVFSVDSSNSQVQLSACAAPTTSGGASWKLAAVANFPSTCGGWSSALANATLANGTDADANVR